MGTPEFAIESLQMLHDSGHALLVVTQPDREKGRKRVLTPPPVKVLAEALGLPVLQFENIKSPEAVKAITKFAPDLMVTVAFGQILSKANLTIAQHGCINVHASLLPKYRGAAPIQWAIIHGEHTTGVTTMLTEEGLDTGDILMWEKTEIGEDETAGDLGKRLSVMGGKLLCRTIEALQESTLTRTKQDEGRATRCSMLTTQTGKIDFSLPTKRIHDLVRGTNPEPGAYVLLDGQTVKIWKTRMTEETMRGAPGECVIANPKQGLFVCTGDGLIEIAELQFSGAKRMDAKSALMGKKLLGRVFE